MTDFRSEDEALFEAGMEAARRQPPRSSADLLARIEADALAVQQELNSAAVPEPRRAGLKSLVPQLGGWAGLAGLAASVVIGIGIGVWQPVDLGIGADQAGSDGLDETLFLSFEDALAEG